MIIDLVGPIDLSKMTDSGQLYNLYQVSNDQFILKHHNDIPIRQVNDHTIESPVDLSEYFDAQTDYKKLDDLVKKYASGYVLEAYNYCRGMRITRRPLHEVCTVALLRYANTQSKIRTSYKSLCSKFSSDHNSFPTLDTVMRMSKEDWDLVDMIGFRSEDLSWFFKGGSYNKMLSRLNDPTFPSSYKAVQWSIGTKNKSIFDILLFGLHIMNWFPKDDYIRRILQREYHGELDLSWCRQYFTLMNYYLKYYERYGYGLDKY